MRWLIAAWAHPLPFIALITVYGGNRGNWLCPIPYTTVYLVLWFTQAWMMCSEVANHGGLFQR